MPAHDTRGGRVTTLVKILLAGNDEHQQDLAPVLGVTPGQITRKMQRGRWTLEDLDDLAAHWQVPVTLFFMEPAELMHLEQDFGPSGWLSEIAAHAA